MHPRKEVGSREKKIKSYTTRKTIVKVTAKRHRPTKRLRFNLKIIDCSPPPPFTTTLPEPQYNNNRLQMKELQATDFHYRGIHRKPKVKRGDRNEDNGGI